MTLEESVQHVVMTAIQEVSLAFLKLLFLINISVDAGVDESSIFFLSGTFSIHDQRNIIAPVT